MADFDYISGNPDNLTGGGAANMADIQGPLVDLKEWLNTDLQPRVAVAVPTFVTTLPVSATDGQEIYFLADDTNGVIWHLRYRAASASAYKWECVGGPPPNALLAAQFQPGTAITLSGGPSLTLPLAGDYDMEHGTWIQLPGVAAVVGGLQHLYSNGATVNQPVQWYDMSNTTQAPILNQLRRGARMTGRAAGEVWDLRQQSLNASGNALFGDRYLRIAPVRVG